LHFQHHPDLFRTRVDLGQRDKGLLVRAVSLRVPQDHTALPHHQLVRTDAVPAGLPRPVAVGCRSKTASLLTPTKKKLLFRMLKFNPKQPGQLPRGGTHFIQSGFPLSGALNIISKKNENPSPRPATGICAVSIIKNIIDRFQKKF